MTVMSQKYVNSFSYYEKVKNVFDRITKQFEHNWVKESDNALPVKLELV